MSRRLLSLGPVGLALVVACSSTDHVGTATGNDTADPNTEDLRLLPGTFSRRLVDNIVASDTRVTEGFGVPDDHVPYPDTYWPFFVEGGDQNGIDNRWQGRDAPSALEKYAALVSNGDAAAIAQAKQWEHDHHGPGLGVRQGRTVQSWEGHCPGWTGAAMANAPLVKPVFVKPDPHDVFVPCTASEQATMSNGCVRFEIGDINGLEAEVYVDGVQPLVGSGCFKSTPDVDEFDRIKRNPDLVANGNGRGCKGLNPGAFLTIFGNRMKRDHLPFAINAQHPGSTAQIWNQPAYRYVVNAYEEITTQRAIALVAQNDQGTPLPATYIFNPVAKGFVLVDITVAWVREHQGPNGSDTPTTEFVSGLRSTRKHRIKAVIELDADPLAGDAARASANIIGGEYLDDPALKANAPFDTFGPSRLDVPTFVWLSVDSGRDDLSVQEADNAAIEHHNPFVKPSLVKRLIALGQR